MNTKRKAVFNFLYWFVFIHFRRRRMKRFFRILSPEMETRVIDIGGACVTWRDEAANGPPFPVLLLNNFHYDDVLGERFSSIDGDATALPFADNTFDIAFSNSVIEHMGSWERQQAFAREARRVAPRIWIQTPARSFPIECHLLAPFIQYLPRQLQHRIVRFTPRGLLSPEAVHQIVDEVRLLTYREFSELFPDCRILQEKICGITKSYIAVR